jgi:hypothetical protein
MILLQTLHGKICYICFLICTVCTLSQASFPLDKVRIEITTDWGRYVGKKWRVSKKKTVIVGDRGSYRARGHSIPSKTVELFLAALGEPRIEKPSLENCNVDVSSLAANLGVSEEEYQHRFESELSSLHLDNEYSLRATVTVDGKTIVLRSESDQPFMLPWQAADGAKNYNCHISRALAPMLPDSFSAKDLLSDAYLKEAIR